MAAEPAELARLIGDPDPVDDVAERIRGRRIFVIGTGTSFHAANQGAYLLRLAGVDAVAVAAADAVLWGPAPQPGDALVVLSHRGTKRYTSQALREGLERGVITTSVGGVGSGAEVETVEQERAGTYTVSHLAALVRLGQLARALGAELDLEVVPDAVAAVLADESLGVQPPARGLDFVGAGPNQWTAAEGALKVREAAHVYASSYSVEQLLHGSGWALDGRDALVCLDGGGPGSERLTEVSAAAERRGARVHRFAATGRGEPLSIFPLTTIVQRLALDFALQLGTDPDTVVPAEWRSLEL
jgi:glucosamine--fructose-6-phosphate aminotransferase (isomerizing)